MNKYKVMLRGENFLIKFEDKVENLGFYTTRVVNANSAEEAESRAIDLIRNDEELLSVVQRVSDLNPKIYLESITEASRWQRLGGKGYTFWPMESE